VLDARGDQCAIAVALWVFIDLATGRPKPLGDRFAEIYTPAAGGRAVRARLEHPEPRAALDCREWPLRRVDADVLGHVNNAAYWAPVEESIGARADRSRRMVGAELEYRAGIEPTDAVRLVVDDDLAELWCWLRVGDETRASAVVRFATDGASRPPA
jgi:acyl-ACP thioesterase